jgi:hypothetical protein
MSQIELPKKLINVSETKTKFNSNILPLTLDEKILVLYCKIVSK